jgi:hypothetical protein
VAALLGDALAVLVHLLAPTHELLDKAPDLLRRLAGLLGPGDYMTKTALAHVLDLLLEPLLHGMVPAVTLLALSAVLRFDGEGKESSHRGHKGQACGFHAILLECAFAEEQPSCQT